MDFGNAPSDQEGQGQPSGPKVPTLAIVLTIRLLMQGKA
ncbi:unnamed protein product, partial [Soboliphyme baturini]|uniref:Uncharacterized protein n=1 Tax=Soboliphyme baturini TaxID=241478 RepID=A0A183ISU4_9BILA